MDEKMREFMINKIKSEYVEKDHDMLPHIFEKFYQANKAHSGEENGLGLALVKRIVDILGGEIDLSSTPGKGTSFFITLPLSS